MRAATENTMESLRNDVHKPPEQLEREADTARSAVEGTIAELEQRLSPGEMLDRVMDVVKRNGGEFGDNLLTQVRNNPLPTILAGVGFAWLMAASKRPPPRGSSYRWNGDGDWNAGHYEADDELYGDDGNGSGRWSSAASSARSAASSARDKAASATESAKRTAADAAESVTSAAHRAADATSHAARRVADASRTSVRGVSDGYAYLCREQPFLLGAIAIAAGAALGAMLPSTEMEDELLGETSDAAKARLKSEAQARTEELREAAAQTIDTVKEEIARTDSHSEPMAEPRVDQPRVDGSQPPAGSPALS